MYPALPVARALAIAGDRVAGGVGTHETALASPERIDLGGRCVLPGFTDSHVHFPTWSLAQRQVRLEDTATLDEALERVAAAMRDVRPGGWLRALGVWQRLRDEGALHLRVWQSIPADQVEHAAALRVHSGFGDDLIRVGYLKAFMDGTLGSQTARLLDGSGVEITSREELVEIIRAGA